MEKKQILERQQEIIQLTNQRMANRNPFANFAMIDGFWVPLNRLR